VFAYRPKAASTVDLALLDWQTRKVTNLTNEKAEDREWSLDGWSKDGRFIYADRGNAGGTDSDIYQIDAASANQENLTPPPGTDPIRGLICLARRQQPADRLE
jgi:Tol biopolymer transport system component